MPSVDLAASSFDVSVGSELRRMWKGAGMIDGLVPEKPVENGPRRGLRALYHWLTGAPSPPDSSIGRRERTPRAMRAPDRIGHYAITHKLGAGAMGVVYAARDERLERTVALKTMSSLASDETARKRFWREARAAASVNHPNVCQIYEIGEDRGELFIAMELLEGEPLAERLKQGAMSVSQAMPIGLEMLAALSALHTRGIVHRDLKPSNVFLTPHGVKLLDFGLARPEPARNDRPRRRSHAAGFRDGHAEIHGARADHGRAGRCPGRPVRGRRNPVRDARRPTRVSGDARLARCCTRRCPNNRRP